MTKNEQDKHVRAVRHKTRYCKKCRYNKKRKQFVGAALICYSCREKIQRHRLSIPINIAWAKKEMDNNITMHGFSCVKWDSGSINNYFKEIA